MKLVIFLIILFAKNGLYADLSSQVNRYVSESVSIQQKVQKEEDKWLREKEKLENRCESLRSENKAISDDIKRLKKEIDLHSRAINNLQNDISRIENIKKHIRPFLEDTYKRLVFFVKTDLPFLKNERNTRLKNLEKTLYDPSISMNEKFRRLMEALFIEAEYGNNVEVYQDRIKLGKNTIYVNILRLGRISLFFQSLDKKISGYFDPSSGWKRLPERYNRNIKLAIDMARKRRPADLVDLPIGRIKKR